MISSTDRCLLCRNNAKIVLSDIFDTRFGIEGFYNVARCESCGLEQLLPKPENDELVGLYKKHYNFIDNENKRYKTLRQKFLSSIFFDIWSIIDGDITFQLIKGKGHLLDVGCNEGRGLEIYKKNGFYVEGLEINSEAASVARAKGFKVHIESLENIQTAKQYDVLVLTNVIEHSLSPINMIKNANNRLLPGGQLWISCPNSQSWYRNLFGKYWINWHPPFHISHFSEKSLTKLLVENGFAICSIKNETPAVWVTQSLISSLYASQGKITKQLQNSTLVVVIMLIVRLICFPILWLGNMVKRGDCLVVTAMKR